VLQCRQTRARRARHSPVFLRSSAQHPSWADTAERECRAGRLQTSFILVVCSQGVDERRRKIAHAQHPSWADTAERECRAGRLQTSFILVVCSQGAVQRGVSPVRTAHPSWADTAERECRAGRLQTSFILVVCSQGVECGTGGAAGTAEQHAVDDGPTLRGPEGARQRTQQKDANATAQAVMKTLNCPKWQL